MTKCMLTTVDNPFNPFDNFEEWYKIDMQFGYNTCALLAREVPSSDSLPESYVNSIKEGFIDRWVSMFPQTYKKVTHEVDDEDYEAMIEEIEADIKGDDVNEDLESSEE